MKTRILALLAFGLLAFRGNEERISKRKYTVNGGPTGSVYIIVDKSEYSLSVYDDEGWYATYPAVFGSKSLDDKYMEGDRRTPEGTFHITSKRPHEKWHKMMLLDYPNKESYAKFNQRKAQGVIPRSARIGGGIAIHGTWPHDNIVVDDYTNWTNGCISVKNEDVDELFGYLQVGTKVIIQR